MKALRVGIIGSGGIAQSCHFPGWQKTEGAEIVACCDAREQAARDAAKKFNVSRVYTDYGKMLREVKPDVVSVCTPNAFHMAPTIAALRSGAHVLCEKPIAMNAVQGAAMCRAAKAARRLLMIGLNNRFTTESQRLKGFIKGGDLGQVYFTRVLALRRRGVPGWGVFIRKDMSGGGPLADIGVHLLDLALWLIGHPEPVSVSGAHYTKFGTRGDIFMPWGQWDPKKYTVEDMGVGFVRFKNGSTLALEASWSAHISDDVWNVSLMGTKGGATTSPFKIYTEKQKTLLDVTPVRLPEVESHTEEIRAFARAIRAGGPSPVPGEQALMAQRILDGIYRSQAAKKEVRV